MGWRTAALLCSAWAMVGAATAQPHQVFVVRHAERSAAPADDPHLSPQGQDRAEQLAHTLAAAGVTQIITTHYRRTRETAAPLARSLGLTPQVLPVRRGELDAHIQEVAGWVRASSGSVLVVGHSNTVALIVAALSASRPLALCETSHAALFVLAPAQPERPAVRINYGKPDPLPGTECQ